jgi:hypothetical protein
MAPSSQFQTSYQVYTPEVPAPPRCVPCWTVTYTHTHTHTHTRISVGILVTAQCYGRTGGSIGSIVCLFIYFGDYRQVCTDQKAGQVPDAIGARMRASTISAPGVVLLDEDLDQTNDCLPFVCSLALVHPIVVLGALGVLHWYPGWLRAVIDSSPLVLLEGSATMAEFNGLAV